MMKTTIFFVGALSVLSAQLFCMQPQALLKPHHDELSQKVEHIKQLLTDRTRSTDTIIAGIKTYLNDQSLSKPENLQIQTELVKRLSTQFIRVCRQSHLINDMSPRECFVKIFPDGTRSVERLEYDCDDCVVIQKKPTSPWYSLSFQEFIRAYLTACQNNQCVAKESVFPEA